MTLGAEERGKKLTIRNAAFAAKCAKTQEQMHANNAEKQQNRDSCAVFFCPEPTCSAIFVKQAYLEKHVAVTNEKPSKHWYCHSNAIK
jgi:uncharacterized C2H2 Zn-finger protein